MTYQRWAVSRLFDHGIVLVAGNLGQAAVAFASQLLLMRLLEPSDFGQFATVFAAIGLVQTILSMRLNVLAIRTPDNAMTEDWQRTLYTIMLVETVLAFVIMLGWLLICGDFSLAAMVLIASVSLGHWTNSVAAFYERGMNYRALVLTETTSQMVGHGAAMALALAGAGANALYLREGILALLRLILLSRIGAIPLWRLKWLSAAEWKLVCREARVPWLDGIVDGGYQRMVVLMAGSLLGAHATGILVQAYRLAIVPHQMLSPLVTRLAANVFRGMEQPAGTPLLRRATVLVVMPLALVAAMALAVADPVIPWLFGPGWTDAAAVLMALVGVMVASSPFELLRTYCLSRHRSVSLMAARVTQYVAFLAALVAVQAVWSGAIGFAVAMSASAAITTIVLMVALTRSARG